MTSEGVNKPKAIVKRSRLGCINCRKRKKKCDEIKPICTGCLNRNIVCEYKINEKAIIGELSSKENLISKNGSEIVSLNGTKIYDNVPEKISTISSLRSIVGDTVMRILEHKY